jgi:chromosome transmission fidelity protein 1
MPLQIEYEEGDERPRNFHHPYEPYPIQLDFMNALYDCIEKGQVGIFESPTGARFNLYKSIW